MLENYLSIQQLLYDNKFTFNIQIDHDVDQESIFLPPMLTQPFIENAIKHGLSNTSENGKIDIHFFLKENKLFFEVTDNGKGFDTSTNFDMGVGLLNMKKRASLIQADIKLSSKIDIGTNLLIVYTQN